MKRRFSILKISMIGVMAALTFAAHQLQINIPTVLGNTRLHLGNVLCLLCGMLLGPIPGGFAAGIGAMFFDFTNPLYIASAPFTFVFKFMMAFVCGCIVWRKKGAYLHNIPSNVVAGFCGAMTYVALYLSKNFLEDIFFLRTEMETALIDLAQKGAVSGFNGILAFVVAVPLSMAIRKGLERAGLYSKLAPSHK
ncbi:ECF transporter S component [Ruminococcaceae bacterium OttesenSCG-928-L11]|nr:ECF transporter S component [Ruminococcaceae bacterium OttesenSCG-928-L11]